MDNIKKRLAMLESAIVSQDTMKYLKEYLALIRNAAINGLASESGYIAIDLPDSFIQYVKSQKQRG